MSTHQFLSDKEFAQLFMERNTVARGEDVLDLEPRVEVWLSRSGMGHRNAFAIAVEVSKLARPGPKLTRVPSPEEAARLDDLHQGIGDHQPLTADTVAGWSMDEYRAARGQLIRRSSGTGVGLFGPLGR